MGWKYGVITSLNPLGKSLKIFIRKYTKFLQFKNQMPHTLLFLEMISLFIDIMIMEWVIKYMLHVQKRNDPIAILFVNTHG